VNAKDSQSRASPLRSRPRTLLVLGGGGMKGMVHVGVLRALHKLGIVVDEIIGTSIGACVGSFYASGISVPELETLVSELTKKDFFQIKVLKFLVKGYRHQSLYKGETFMRFLEDRLPAKSFADLELPFFCNALSLDSGRVRYFGLPGCDSIPLTQAVYASASLPGIFEPLEWEGDHLIDGGIVDSLPLRLARARKADLIIAVDLSMREFGENQFRKSLPWILFRSFELAQEAATEHNLHAHAGVDMIHIKAPVGHLGVFDFSDLSALVDLGERQTLEVLASHPRTSGLCDPNIVEELRVLGRTRKPYAGIVVDQETCIHCGVCRVTCATDAFTAAESGTVVLKAKNYECTLDGACVRNCPVDAIDLTLP
jgi:NTE family protein